MADESELEQIRSRVSIVEVVSAHTTLKKTGATMKGLCPFHKEKTPSFTVNEERGLWHCFGCGEGGDIFGFVMKAENLVFGDAVERLARQGGVVLKAGKRTSPEQRSLKDRALKVNERACRIFQSLLLKSADGEKFRAYLERRRIGPAETEAFRLGASRDSWDYLLKQLAEDGFSAEDAAAAGLAIQRESGGMYDRFRNRLMFPLVNVVGDVVGFGARTLGDDTPKYINTPQSPAFDKGKMLYALDIAKKHAADNALILTEGYMDVIALHREGFRNSVASMGTALTETQVSILRRYCSAVYLAYDADFAGDAATLRGIEMLVEQGLGVRVVNLPQGKDPDDVMKESGRAGFTALMEKSPGFFEHFARRHIQRLGGDSPESQKEIILALAPLIEKTPNPLLKDHQVNLLADMLGLEERQVRLVLFTARPSAKRPGRNEPPAPAEAAPGGAVREKNIFHLLLSSQENAIKILDALTPDDFLITPYRKLFVYVRNYREKKGGFDPDEFLSLSHPQEAMQLLSGIALKKEEAGVETRVDECIARIKGEAKKRKLASIKKKIEQAEREGDKKLVLKLALEASELKKSL